MLTTALNRSEFADSTKEGTRVTTAAVWIARVFIFLAFLALVGAWITEVTHRDFLGMSQQHFFNDGTVLSLIGIALFLDAYWHAQGR